MGAEEDAKSALHGGKVALEELADSFFKWVLPLLGFIAGLFSAVAIGGSGLFYQAILKIVPEGTANTGQMGRLLTALLFGLVGLGVYQCGKGVGSDIGKGVVYFFAAFCFGIALAWVGLTLNFTSIPNGLLDELGETLADDVSTGIGNVTSSVGSG